MPIYKTNGEKDGKKKYIVRINYVADSGEPKQLTRVAYGSTAAKNLETKLTNDIKLKGEKPMRKMKVQELLNEYKEVKRYEVKETTQIRIDQNFNCYILPTFKDYCIDKITPKAVQEWKIALEKRNLSLNTKKLAFCHLRTFINYAIKMDYLNTNPLTRVGGFRKNSANDLADKSALNIYMPDEFKSFITVAKKIAEEKEKQNNLSEWDFYVFFNIAFYTGLRKGEIFALKWSDIEGEYLTVKRTVTQRLSRNGGDIESTAKSKKSMRTIQLPMPLTKILIEQKKRQRLLHNFTDDFRICSNIRDTTLQRRNRAYAAMAGLKTIRVHDFRHSHASVLANSNINIQEISRRLGHSQVEITWNTYCHLYPKEEEKAVEILNGCN